MLQPLGLPSAAPARGLRRSSLITAAGGAGSSAGLFPRGYFQRAAMKFSTPCFCSVEHSPRFRSEEHTSELQSLMRISYAVFCLKKKKGEHNKANTTNDKYDTRE